MAIAGAFIVPHPPLIIPEVGRGEEERISATVSAYRGVADEIAALSPEAIIIISPHSVSYADYIHISPGSSASGSLKQFGAKTRYSADYDEELVNELSSLCFKNDFPAGTDGERQKELDHGTLIPLHFIGEMYSGFKSVRIGIAGLSHLEHYKFGMMLNEAIENLGRNAVIVASGDLSHKLLESGPYGYAPEGPQLDERLTSIMASGAFDEFWEIDADLSENAAECGLKSFIIMAGALNGKSVEPKLISYEGTFGVGYAVAAFKVGGADSNRDFYSIACKKQQNKLEGLRLNESPYVKLARTTLEEYVATGKMPALDEHGLPDEMQNSRAGVFVSIKKYGNLRGCIGTIAPTMENIAREIMENAILAGMRDNRFNPVTKSELNELTYSVDVLGKAEKVSDKTQLDIKRYGVIVTKGARRGLLLPNLEGVNGIEHQLEIACSKAGINPNDNYNIERFEVVRHT